MADTETAYEPRLKRVYREEVRKTLQDQFSYQNEMQVPRVDKIVINMGVKEHIVFPEINYDKVDQMWGMDIIVCTTANTDDEARALLTAFNFPFRQ
jgi:ribosomal protein L5